MWDQTIRFHKIGHINGDYLLVFLNPNITGVVKKFLDVKEME